MVEPSRRSIFANLSSRESYLSGRFRAYSHKILPLESIPAPFLKSNNRAKLVSRSKSNGFSKNYDRAEIKELFAS